MKRRIKRAFSTFMVVALLLTAAPLSGFVGIDIPKVFNLSTVASAATADDIISTARNQKGSYGSDINKFTTWFYGKSTSAAWCAIFVSWCANQVGVLNDAIPKNASCASMMAWFKNRGEYHSVSSDYVPQKGDVIFFDTDGSGVTHHVEFVAQSGFITENGKTKVKCIGGNTSNSSFNGSDYVAEKNRYIYQSSCKVMGYAHPSYGTENDYSQNTYSFTFNANGGTLGSAGSFTTKYGNDFQILNTTCTRSGYNWAGWHVKRNNDNKWFVAGQGWCTESQINNNGYIKKVYSNYQSCKLDDSWTSGISGDCSYTFYAVWIQSRQNRIKIFMSPYGEGYDHLTAMNNATDSGFTQECIYAWYVIYDGYTGDLVNTYQNNDYNIKLAIYDPNGDLIGDCDYHNSDANWIRVNPHAVGMSGTYLAEATLTGDLNAEVATTYEVSYDPDFSASKNSLSLNLNGTNSQTVTINVGGSYPGLFNVRRKLSNSNVSTSWGSWNGTSCDLTVTGNKVGTTEITVELFERYTGNDNTIATITIPVTVTANTYTISYNANGGSGVPSSQTKYYGTDLTLSSTKPTRTGYTFLGWSTSSTATSATYQPGATFSSNADTTLYAVWSKDTYNLTYDSNGGTAGPNIHMGEVVYTIKTEFPTRFGYTFLGWSKSSTATSATYLAGDTITLTSNTTLYAVWKQTSLYSTASLNATIAYCGQEYYYKYTPTTNGTYVIYSTGDEDTRVYLYDSLGTELANNDDGGEDYNFRLQYDMAAGTTYYYKVKYYNSSKIGQIPIKFGPIYTVTYNSNGGSGAPSSQCKDYGADIVLTSSTPTKSGYIFLGWSTISTATTAAYQPGDICSANANLMLYAIWSKLPTYTISYNANGGSGAPSSQTKIDGTTLLLSTTKPTRTGYTLLGWSTSIAATSATYQPGDSFTVNADTTLYAVWKANTYTVKYNANGGSGTMSNSSHTYDVSKSLTSNVFTRSGYTFLGWSTSSTATTATYTNGQSVKNLTSTNGAVVNLYAVWKLNDTALSVNSPNNATISTGGEIKYYTFTPSETGAYVIYSTGSVDTKVYLYNSSGTELANDDDGGDGTNFRLQYNLVEGTTYRFGVRYYNSSNTGTIPFKFGKVYTITYNANGGSGAPSSQTKDYGTALTLSSTAPTRTGYTFLGWSTSSTATSAAYTAGGTYSSESNATLYAVWKANTYSVKYNANGGSGMMSNSAHTYDVSKTLTSNAFTRSGYTFLGWSTSSSATTVTYTNSQSVKNLSSVNGDTVNLYAVWSKIPTYTISYNANGGSNAPSSQTKTKDVALTLSNTKPTRTGYTFLGWSTSSTATTATYQAGGSFTANADTVLYAIWKANTYTVKYNANGGSGSMSSSSHTYDVSKALTSNAFTRSGYSFLGWSKDSSATTATYTNRQSVKNLTSVNGDTVNLYAVWHKHSYTSKVTTAATCSTVGVRTYTCSGCSDSYTETIAKLGHNYSTSYTVDTPATCTTAGSKSQHCSRCSSKQNVTAIPATGHSYTSKVTTAATCTATGVKTYTCSTCSHSYTETIAKLGHNYSTSYTVDTPATCTTAGSKSQHCTRCTAKQNVTVIPATGHNYVNGTCSSCGKTNVTTSAAITVSSASASAGNQVKVTISLKNNPGITSMLLSVNYDESKLQLVKVEDCENLGSAFHSNVLSSPFTLSWANDTATSNYTYNGDIVVLTFKVKDDAEVGATPITVTYEYNNYDIIDKDMNRVEFNVENGSVNITDVLIGDVNNDGNVNTLDRVILTRYIAKWAEYPAESINMVAADVNCDGSVNTLDRVILTRYIAHWGGYESLPYNN